MRHLLFLPFVFFTACVETAPRLQHDAAPVEVLGPLCTDRCAVVAERCAPFDLAQCEANCDAECLVAAGTDCLAARRCGRPAPTRPWSAGPSGTGVKDTAASITFPTAEGDWPLELEWTGEDSYVVFAHSGETAALFAGSLRPLLQVSPRNVHYFFGWVSDQPGFEQARARWEVELQLLPPADRDHWFTHVHFVRPRLDQVATWVGTLMRDSRINSFAIDRQQRIRQLGMLGRLTNQGVAPELPMLANEVRAFNFEAEREVRLAAQQVEVVTLATTQTAYDTIDVDVTIPDPSRFDTLEVDLSLECPAHLIANCGAWDYLSHLRLCEPATGADGGASWSCTKELARWITPYWREGRWVTDISAQLATLGSGGLKHLRWTANGQWDPRRTDYITSLSLRFIQGGKGMRPTSATPLWTGGDWNASYDAAKLPQVVMIPASAKKVELVTLTTGHGGVQPTNCAEFCNHNHLFTVNGVLHRQSFPEAQQPSTCVERVDEGVVPNQLGTWYYGRGGWCPGQDVAPWVVDVTADVTKGQANTLTYRTEFNGGPVTAGLGNIVLSSWLVVWE